MSSDYTKLLLQHEVIFIRAAEILRARDELTPARRFAFARQLAADGRLLFRRSMRAAARRCWHAAATLDRAGLRSAYGRRTSRPLLTLLGPELTEQVMAALASVREATRKSTSGRCRANRVPAHGIPDSPHFHSFEPR